MRIAPHVRLWIQCTGTGPTVPADNGDLPVIVISHGRRTFSTERAERSWTHMQRRLARDSSSTLRVIALDGRHVIQDDQPALVAAAIDEAAADFPKKKRLHCAPAFAANHGRCVG